ncbi:MAG: SAP domain-containing protein [Methanosphaera sp.]|nr:SAP domain-containing protein [Methanosphaera sp.]
MNEDIIVREDEVARIIYGEMDNELLDTIGILKKDYPYILKSMEDEDFMLENMYCHMFKEILIDTKVVGFCTYYISTVINEYSLNAIYVLPGFRGNKSFYNEIKYILDIGSSLSIYEPTHLIIELLLGYGFASMLNDNLVASAFRLDIPSESYLCNTERVSLNETDFYTSNVYDLNMSATILLYDISSSEDSNVIFYSRLLDDDMKRYDAFAKRQDLENDYFEVIKDEFLSNYVEWAFILDNLKKSLPKTTVDVYELVGKPPQMSDALNKMIAYGLVSVYNAVKLQEQLINENTKGMVLDDSLIIRYNYLCYEYETGIVKSMEEVLDTFVMEDNVCPYCSEKVNPTDDSCVICGFNLSYDFRDELFESALMVDDEESFDGNGEFEDSLSHITSEDFKRYTDALIELINETGVKKRKRTISIHEYTETNDLIILVYTAIKYMMEGTGFDKACRFTQNDTNVSSDEIRDYLIENDYVDMTVDEDNWQIVGQGFVIPELKEILKSHNQKVSGSKQELIDRIAINVPLDDIVNRKVYITNHKSKKLFESKSLNLYMKYLKGYSYDSFMSVYDEDLFYDEYELLEYFMELNEYTALDMKDQQYAIENLEARLDIIRDYGTALDLFKHEIKTFLSYLNPICPVEDVLVFEIINSDNIESIRRLCCDGDWNLKQIYDEVYANMKYDTRLSKDVGYHILLDALESEDLRGLDVNIRNEYFSENKVEKIMQTFTTLDDFK